MRVGIYDYYFRIKGNKTIHNGFLFTLFNFMSTGVNFILLLVLSKFLTPTEYGYLNLFNTFITLMMIFISFNAEKIIVVNYFKVSKLYTSETITSIIAFSSGLLAFYSLLIVVFRRILEPELGFSSLFLILATAYCFLDKLSGFNKAIWKAEQNATAYGTYTLLIVAFNCLGTILLIIMFHMGWYSRAMAQFGVSVLFGLISTIFLFKRRLIGKSIYVRRRNLKESLAFGIPLVPNTLSWWAMQGVNRFIINSYYGPAEVGLYSFATHFANIIHIISSSFAQSWHVDVFRNLTEKKLGYVTYLSRFTRRMIVIYAVITTGICFSCLFIIPLIFPDYTGSLKFLLPLCVGAFAHCIGSLFDCYIFYNKRTKLLMNITISVSMFNVCLGFILIKYDLLAAAYIAALSEIIITALYIFYALKDVPLKFFSK